MKQHEIVFARFVLQHQGTPKVVHPTVAAVYYPTAHTLTCFVRYLPYLLPRERIEAVNPNSPRPASS